VAQESRASLGAAGEKPCTSAHQHINDKVLANQYLLFANDEWHVHSSAMMAQRIAQNDA